MGSALSKNRAKAASSTETILLLQEACRRLSRGGDVDGYCILSSEKEHISSGEAKPNPYLKSINHNTHVELEALKETLSFIEQKLRSRGNWHLPRRDSQAILPSISNISDLADAVKSLTAKIDSTHPSLHTSPQQFFAGRTWQWDPTWKEFYTHVPKHVTYIYLSRWRLSEWGRWYHVSMAGSNQTAAEAMDLIGSWEDWTYDPAWREWYIPVQGEAGDDARYCVYASPWQEIQGRWYYVGRISGIYAPTMY